MSHEDRVAELESTIAGLEATVEGLTEELVESKERIRQLETATDGVSVTSSVGNLRPNTGVSTSSEEAAEPESAADLCDD